MKIFPDIEEIGFIQKNHGFDGLLKLKLNVDLIGKSFPKFIWIQQYGKPVPFLVLSYNILNESSVIISIEDIENETQANQLKNEVFYCETSIYDDYFIAIESYDYLIDLIVIDEVYGELGPITDVIENENSHANLVVDYNSKEILIPFVDEFILNIDEELNKMDVQLPDGLIDLYVD